MPTPASCLLSGPDDPLVDAEVWRYDLILGTPASGDTPAQPFNLAGSDLSVVLKTLAGWETASTLSTLANWPGRDGTITVTDAANGAVSIVSDPWLRTYRVRVGSNAFTGASPIQIRGDVMRLAQGDPSARPEYLGYIQFPLRASTTQWPAPAS